MNSKDTLNQQIILQNTQLMSIVATTFAGQPEAKSRFNEEFHKRFSESLEEKRNAIRQACRLEVNEIALLVEELLKEKPVEIVTFPISLPPPSLYSIKELQNLSLM